MKTPTLLAIVAALAAPLSLADAAQARERHTTVTGPHGKSATRDVVRQHGDVQSSTTGPNGKTVTRTTTVQK